MPVGEYFEGHGSKVMSSMQRKHGDKAGKRIFYATANKRGMKPAAGRAARRGMR